MRTLIPVLATFTAIIFGVTAVAAARHGYLWPATFIADLATLDWRAQFNSDLLMHLLLLGAWVSWREGFTLRGHLFGSFCVVWGGMFSFPYLLYAYHAGSGDLTRVLLGVHADTAPGQAVKAAT